MTPAADTSWALTVAVIYFGSCIAFGWLTRRGADWLMSRYGSNLQDVQKLSDEQGARPVSMLDVWRKGR